MKAPIFFKAMLQSLSISESLAPFYWSLNKQTLLSTKKESEIAKLAKFSSEISNTLDKTTHEWFATTLSVSSITTRKLHGQSVNTSPPPSDSHHCGTPRTAPRIHHPTIYLTHTDAIQRVRTTVCSKYA